MAFDLRAHFGARGNGVDNEVPAWKAANAAIKAQGGGRLVVPYGSYGGLRDGASASIFRWDAPNSAIEFEPGSQLIALPAPNQTAQVATLSFDAANNVRVYGGRINGGWGATAGVTDSYKAAAAGTIRGVQYDAGDRVIDGINFGNQKDPKSHGIRVRGCSGVKFYDTEVVDAYGDLWWVGAYDHDNSPTTPAIQIFDVLLSECRGSVAARHGVTLTGPTHNVRVLGGGYEEALGRPFGIEDGSAEDAQIIGVKLRPWWSAGSSDKDVQRHGIVIGGAGTNYSERIIVERCDVVGSMLVNRVIASKITRNTVVCPWGPECKSWAPFVLQWACDRIAVTDNDFSSSCAAPNTLQDARNAGRAGMIVDRYASGTDVSKWSNPRNIELTGNHVSVSGPGVHGAAQCGGRDGIVRWEGNTFDMTGPDGRSNGGHAFDGFAEKAGQRIMVRGGSSRNATGSAYRMRFSGDPTNRMVQLGVGGMHAWDDQTTPTTTAVFEMGPQRYVDRADVGAVTRSVSVPADFVGWP